MFRQGVLASYRSPAPSPMLGALYAIPPHRESGVWRDPKVSEALPGGRVCVMYPAERRFASALRSIGWRYVAQPQTFKMRRPYRSYRPDFYVHENDTYYEVVGTNQAYFRSRKKYQAFARQYPDIKFVIIDCGANVHPDYELDRLEPFYIDPDVSWPYWPA